MDFASFTLVRIGGGRSPMKRFPSRSVSRGNQQHQSGLLGEDRRFIFDELGVKKINRKDKNQTQTFKIGFLSMILQLLIVNLANFLIC